MADERPPALAAHRELVQALLHGDAFDTPPAERRLVETHISSVLLEGAHAWKLRKPLKLPFLDFSTLQARHDDCLEELRLNRRTAPALYLDVQPVCGSDAAPRIGRTGESSGSSDSSAPVIDWVLRMQRFDDGALLDAMARAGRLHPAHVDALAAGIAQFQQTLPPSPTAFGTPETVRSWALENFDALAGLADDRVPALRTWTQAQFDRLAPQLAQRRADGRVREGHGDLHLGNLVLLGGTPCPFDALEFNPALRHIDVVADIAFTAMDLHRHALPGLAWRFASAWAEAADDHSGLALLPFFAVYRAMVRAKVARLRRAQGDADAQAACERDLALATSLAAPRRGPPRLVLTSGLSGSGKSTVAQALVEALGAVRLRSDLERKRLFGLAPTQRPTADELTRLYAPEATQRTYARLAALATGLLQAGLDVVVDAAFLRRAERQAFVALAVAQGAHAHTVACSAPLAVLRQRLHARGTAGTDPSDADVAVLERQTGWQEAPGTDERVVAMDTDADAATLAQRVEALARQLGGRLLGPR